VARHAPDVIHVHTPGPVGLLGVLAACRLRLPMVQTYHTDLHAYVEAYRFPARALRVGVRLYAHRLKDARPHQRRETVGPGRRGALDACNELLLSDCDALVVPTQAVLDRIRLPVAHDRTFLVPSGVAARPTTAAAVAAFRDRHAIAPTDRVVLFVGRINREKGIDLLIDAFDRLLAACPPARLVLVGAMYEPKWFASLLRRVAPAVTNRVVLAGEQPADVVAAAYGSADVFAFPSRTDTQALVLQEAALAGLPAVLADRVLHQRGALGPAAGMCTEPEPGAFAAALLWLLDHPDEARDLGQLALAQASRHTPAQYAAAVLDVYRHAARNRASTGAVAVV
jgi:glycosyltransferase involved in cell wall biosynthesis